MSRLLFTSPVELLRTESTLGEFYLGEKPNLLRTELEKKKSMQSKKSILQPLVNNSIRRMQLNTLVSVPWHPTKEKAKKYHKQPIKLLTVLATSLNLGGFCLQATSLAFQSKDLCFQLQKAQQLLRGPGLPGL